MDIWAWVRQSVTRLRDDGQHRLADLIDELPGWVCANDHAKVDAAVPEALALAKRLDDPWLQIFIRHWQLQSRIVNRCDVKDYLGEAVALTEFSSRDAHKSCPQSVCAVQDLCMAYSQKDDRGFVEERTAVANETLARIDASWPCFECIATEKATALLDGGLVAEALEFLDESARAALLADPSRRSQDFAADVRCEALMRRGDYQAARVIAEGMRNEYGGDRVDQGHALVLARTLLGAGQVERAQRTLPRYDDILPTPDDYESWVEVMVGLVDAGLVTNDWHLGVSMRGMFKTLRQRGVQRGTLRVGEHVARLALARDKPFIAGLYIDDMADIVDNLHRELDAPEKLQQLRGDIVAAQQLAVMPAGANAALSPTNADDDPESVVTTLLARACSRAGTRTKDGASAAPLDNTTALTYATAWRRLDENGRALALARARLSARSSDSDETHLISLACDILLHEGQHRELEIFIRDLLDRPTQPGSFAVAPSVEVHLRQTLARSYSQRHDHEGARSQWLLLTQLQPDDSEHWLQLSRSEELLEAWDDALAHVATAIDTIGDGPGQCLRWRQALLATLAERPQTLAEAAKALGFAGRHGVAAVAADPSAATQADFGPCYVIFPGETTALWAQRTGPLTATVFDISAPWEKQHYAERVVFRLVPQGTSDMTDAVPHYEVLRTLRASGYRSFSIDGVHPGAAALTRLESMLETIGAVLQTHSNQHYRLFDSQAENGAKATMAGLFAVIALPVQTAPAALERLLSKWAAVFPAPMVWADLLDLVGDETRATQQRASVSRYGL